MVMRMLDNTKKGFAEELSLGFTLATVLSLVATYTSYTTYSKIEFFAIIFVASYVLVGGTLRIIRWAIVFKSPAYLLLLNLTAFALIGISYDALSRGLSFYNILTAVVLLSIVGFYYGYLLHLRKQRKLLSGTDPLYIKILVKTKLTKLQRLTLIFPDRYIKYLETGDKRFLRDEGNGERKG